MKPSESEEALRKRVGPDIDASTPRRAFEAMFAFYVDKRVEDVDIDSDGDMLLYQWGVYSFTGPASFQLDLTRQFCIEDEDEPYQLSLTLHFAPSDSLRQLGDGNKWCDSPRALPEFRQFVESSAAFKALADAHPSRVDLDFEQY